MGYETDWKPTKVENTHYKCLHCKSDEVEYRRWVSSDGGHTDYLYRCKDCDKEWWAEGADA